MPGRYFPGGAPPMLFVQGSADTVNLPWTSVQMYAADQARARYYLDLFGATHTIPYWGTNRVEQIVAASDPGILQQVRARRNRCPGRR